METTDYNGWTNRETWATMLHIDNDQWLQETAMDYAKTALEEHEPEEEGDISEAISCLEDTIQNWIEEDLLTLDNIAGNKGLWLMLTDIGSLYRVNWREIAQSLLDDVKQEVSA